MRKRLSAGHRMRVLASGLLVLLGALTVTLACGPGGAASSADQKSRILKATNTLLGPPDPSITQENIVGMLAELLDLVVELTPDNQYKPEITSRIGVAKELIMTKSMFNDKAHQYLSLAYRMMTEGKKFEPPKELDEFVTIAEQQEKMRKHMKDMVARSLQALEAGRPGETARILLEMVLMTLTPVKG